MGTLIISERGKTAKYTIVMAAAIVAWVWCLPQQPKDREITEISKTS